ncbi:MAG: hypothetical protein EA381_19710 [Planctomycetaceae bacterium]|nr:MAG: hypothetical protein EA381_19710 [Planctomycetaceae bacterium]
MNRKISRPPSSARAAEAGASVRSMGRTTTRALVAHVVAAVASSVATDETRRVRDRMDRCMGSARWLWEVFMAVAEIPEFAEGVEVRMAFFSKAGRWIGIVR